MAANADPTPVQEANTTGICPARETKTGNGHRGHVPGTERGDDQPVEPVGGGPQQLAVIAQGQDDQPGAHLPG